MFYILKNNNNMQKRLLAVYGSLREGLHNNRVLRGTPQKATERLSVPYKMVSLGSFPGLIPLSPEEPSNEVTFELYEVDNEVYHAVEFLEGYPDFYGKQVIKTSHGNAEIYVLNSEKYGDLPVVQEGDWKDFYAKRHESIRR